MGGTTGCAQRGVNGCDRRGSSSADTGGNVKETSIWNDTAVDVRSFFLAALPILVGSPTEFSLFLTWTCSGFLHVALKPTLV